jgi:hypothetical protein
VSVKKKVIAVILLLAVSYPVSYLFVRLSYSEVWEADNRTYVLFPNSAVYYLYRPIAYVDGAVTGMRFHIGPHR